MTLCKTIGLTPLRCLPNASILAAPPHAVPADRNELTVLENTVQVVSRPQCLHWHAGPPTEHENGLFLGAEAAVNIRSPL